jgi:hypothetical protein
MGGLIQEEPGKKRELSDIILAKWIGDALEKHYPGWGWMVHVNSETGLVDVTNTVLASSLSRLHAFRIKRSELTYEDEIVRQAVWAGGEILERMNMPRARYKDGREVVKVDCG